MRRSILAVLVFLAACGSDSSGPSNDVVNVAGSWTGNWANLQGSGLSCNVSGVQMVVNQSGSTFTGTYSNGQITCNGTSGGGTAGTIVNGTISGNTVAFDLDNQAAHQTGTISGNSMSGTAIWTLSVSGTTYTINGTWSASH